MLYLLIFGHVLEEHVEVFPGVRYTSFLIPGLVMMSLLQNAFANASSSLIQSKITGNLVFVLLTPLSHRAWFVAYVGASPVRGLVVGFGVFAVTAWFAWPGLAEPWWMLTFAVLGGTLLGTLGLIAGLWAEKFDQLAAFQNFVIVPMTFLSGVFYSVHSLPPFWQSVLPPQPFFYLIDGFRRGFFGVSERQPLARASRSWAPPRPWSPCWPCACSRLATKSVTDLLERHPMANSTPDEVHQCIAAGLPHHLAVEGDGQHFFATIVSGEFEGKSRVMRHQRVYPGPRRQNAGADPCAVDEDPDARRVGRAEPESAAHGFFTVTAAFRRLTSTAVGALRALCVSWTNS